MQQQGIGTLSGRTEVVFRFPGSLDSSDLGINPFSADHEIRGENQRGEGEGCIPLVVVAVCRKEGEEFSRSRDMP